ncbi:hypothetical protein MNBD_ALPHA04-1379 [hydrothermal vent metagenome]|uniref:Uncharacterized protein n=1 Tax=hydrothermal vent metagenome TaxID=652676 RepID=A0A3B0SRH1_9ZZZZ
MPIRPPALDDRSFEDLVSDLLRRVSAHTPDWKSPQQGDPGWTLIELFAWLSDTILYRANLIPERQRLVFLRLLGVQMRAAMAARGVVQLSFDDKKILQASTIPILSRIERPLSFETLSEVSVMPVEGQCFIKRRPSDFEQIQLDDLLPDLESLYTISGSAAGYVTTPIFAGGQSDVNGVDIAADTVDGSLWIALLAPDPLPATVAAALDALGGGEDNRGEVLNIGVAPKISAPQFFDEIGVRQPIECRWEICTGRGDGNEYLPLDILSDTSGGLTGTGIVRLALPGKDDIGAPSNDVTAQYRAGVGDRPPRIDDPVTASRLVSWIRLRPEPEAFVSSLDLSWAGINCVEIEQRRSYGRQTIGRGTGASGQEFELGATSVESSSLAVQVEEEDGLIIWRQVPDVGAAGANERVYSLDSEAGVIKFGDGVNGKAPGERRAVQVANMRAGGGNAGNLPAGSITQMAALSGLPKFKLLQPLKLTGGADAETLEQAERRIPSAIRHRNRAVTKQDYVELAQQTPGVQIGRIEILEKFKPHQRLENMPGAVSVMVIPPSNRTKAPAPRPDRPLLESVHQWIDERRPLSTELYVVGTDYVPIGISVAVEISDNDRRDEILNNVTNTIHALIWPLAPGGTEGTGWKLGKTVDDRIVESMVARVPGVLTVAPVKLFEQRGSDTAWLRPQADLDGRRLINLESWQLPELTSLGVALGREAPDRLPDMPGGSTLSDAVPVPVVPEHC